ncbi:hypothetical protein [Streptomyces sp. NPDC090021]|uniref:hypothetical protein n=1 Tax=Streptomyces sp. NPDC090021 TaxID=3365919 RepID=UPI0037F815CE
MLHSGGHGLPGEGLDAGRLCVEEGGAGTGEGVGTGRRAAEGTVNRTGDAPLTGAEAARDAAGREEADETAGDGATAAGHENEHDWSSFRICVD